MIFDWQKDSYRYAGGQAFVPPSSFASALIYVGLVVWSLWTRALAMGLPDRAYRWGLLGREIDWDLEEVRP